MSVLLQTRSRVAALLGLAPGAAEWHRAVGFAVLGLVSGVAAGKLSGSVDFNVLPGAVFGVIVGLGLWLARLLRWDGYIVFIGCAGLFHAFAVNLEGSLDSAHYSVAVKGFLAGLLGGGLFAVVSSALLRVRLPILAILIPTVVGAVLGMLLDPAKTHSVWILYVPWQTAYAAAIVLFVDAAKIAGSGAGRITARA